MSMMLASVSDVFEAQLALACGVDWIDVKDPRRGALGALDTDQVRAIVDLIDGRRPVSATIGDCWDNPDVIPDRVARVAETGVNYVKVGINVRDVDAPMSAGVYRLMDFDCGLIAVCMAEQPPRVDDIEVLFNNGVRGIMLDTADKSGPSLTGLLGIAALKAFVDAGRERGLLTGLAGRLQLTDIPVVVSAGADYMGFRSALCRHGQRIEGCSGAAIAAVRGAMRASIIAEEERVDSEVA